MEQQTLLPVCERVNRHADGTQHSATHILRRQCPHCGWHQVINVCAECADYIEDCNDKARKGKSRRFWRCLQCGKSRPMPEGMDILGRA